MPKFLLIDGNSIMNRAFYGISGNRMTSKSGVHTNAIYGFLAILFKNMDEVKPDYLAVSFDLKAPTIRHKIYKDYKANRHAMPDELKEQMPIIKNILKSMNIDIVEKEGYEGDDILGTLSRYGENQGLDVIILSGDRDTYQLITDKVHIRIPHTIQGKTVTEEVDLKKIHDDYKLEPHQLIDIKGLQGDSSDNIPGVAGIGPKTAIQLIQEYKSVEGLYKKIEKNEDNLKGKQRENIVNNKDLAFLSKTLGTINLKVPLDNNLDTLKVEKWDNEGVLKIFEELNFNKYIEKFELDNISKPEDEELIKKINSKIKKISNEELIKILKKQSKIIFELQTSPDENEDFIIKEKIDFIKIYNYEEDEIYKISNKNIIELKEIFENDKIKKISYDMSHKNILFYQENINLKGISNDIKIGAYILDPTDNKLDIENLYLNFLDIDIERTLKKHFGDSQENEQISILDLSKRNDIKTLKQSDNYQDFRTNLICNYLYEINDIELKKLEEIDSLNLYYNIDIPTIMVLSDMQKIGMKINKKELISFGEKIKLRLDELKREIYKDAGEEFNINSTKQLGLILFEKMKLKIFKKTKTGYSTDNSTLEKLKGSNEIIDKILEYRTLIKLNSTYVEGLIPFINKKTGRIHSFFNQTITATGRISSTEPNLQNIPTRNDLGKEIRKAFEPKSGYIYIDADYSQIELRVLASISGDENMINAFIEGKDIHKQTASTVLGKPINEITKEERSHAKAVNFGIVYGISSFGLSEQIGISINDAKKYIDNYLTKYSGIANYMENIKKEAKERGYVETLCKRRRYVKELDDKNFNIRQFGERVAMNTPIQGTAADIMKIAMIDVFKELINKNIDGKIVLQIHDELIIEVKEEEKEKAKEILKRCMENAFKLKVPLVVELGEGKNWSNLK